MADRVQPVPSHLHTVTPRLVFRNEALKAIEFYKNAFAAEELGAAFTTPDGAVVHSEIRVGDSVVYLTDESGDGNGAAPASVGGRVTTILGLNIPNVDELWERAVAAGCEVVYPLADQFYGDRGGRLRDPFGHQWALSTHIEDVSREELDRRMAQYMEDNSE